MSSLCPLGSTTLQPECRRFRTEPFGQNVEDSIRKDYDRAEEFYRKALELDPSDADYAGNYAEFLADVRKDYDRAEELYRQALELDPKDIVTTGNYAFFLQDIRKDYNRAEELNRKALGLDPKDVVTTGDYAIFLSDIRNDYGRAEKLYRKAIELDPKDADWMGNYAKMLFALSRDDEARPCFRQALAATDVSDATLTELRFYQFAHCPDQLEEGRSKLIELLDRGVTSPGWDLSWNIARAAAGGHPYVAELCQLAERLTGIHYPCRLA